MNTDDCTTMKSLAAAFNAGTSTLLGSICVHLCSSVVPLLFIAGCAVGPDYERPAVETPAAYKPIDRVMNAQKDLVEVVHTLKQVVCVKG